MQSNYQIIRHLAFNLSILLLLLSVPVAAQGQNAFLNSRTGTLGIRLDGGVSWSVGNVLPDESNVAVTALQPQGGAGLYYNFNPHFRAGLDYGYTRMMREQLNGTMDQMPDGGVQGTVYRDFKEHFHTVTLLGEYNLLGSSDGRLSLYAGAGAGCLFAHGNSYTIGVKKEVKPGGAGNKISVTGHNERNKSVRPFVPANLSLEYSFLPQVALSLNCGYRFILAPKRDTMPAGQLYGTLGLRFNLSK